MMRTLFALALAGALAVVTLPAWAGANGFSIVNNTGLNMTGLTIRRYGTKDWKDLGSAPSPGGRGSIKFTAPTADIAVVGLEFTSTGQFTSLGTFQ